MEVYKHDACTNFIIPALRQRKEMTDNDERYLPCCPWISKVGRVTGTMGRTYPHSKSACLEVRTEEGPRQSCVELASKTPLPRAHAV